MTTTFPVKNSHLLDISEVSPYSANDPKDVQCFAEVRQVLEKYNVLDRFGICLLHKHFDLLTDERLVETCNHETRTLTIEPVKEGTLGRNGKLIETSWSLDPKKTIPEVSCETYCWEDSKGEHQWSHKKE